MCSKAQVSHPGLQSIQDLASSLPLPPQLTWHPPKLPPTGPFLGVKYAVKGAKLFSPSAPDPPAVDSFSSFSSLFSCELLKEALLISYLKEPSPVLLGSLISPLLHFWFWK